MAETIDQLQIEITNRSENANAGLDKLVSVLERLKSVAKGGIGLTAVKNQLKSLSEVVNKINVSKSKLKSVVEALSPLQNIQKSNLGSALNQLKKIPEVISALETADLTKFGQQIQELVIHIKPLATEMEKVSAGFSRLPSNIQKAINANAKLTQSVNNLKERKMSLTQTVRDFGVQAMYLVRIVNRVLDALGEWFSSSSEFVEATNLFTVAMGNGAQAAYKYGEAIQEVLGINIQDWITSLGTFNQMFLGFGIKNSEANQMSQLLTQIAYDISSLFNVDVRESMDKLQSGVAGMVKGMRDYGVELTVAAIQETAYAHGINKSVHAMSVAEKVQLRTLTILEKTKNMQGDLARTLVTPANALRILQNKWEIFKRTLGETVSIIAVKVIPVFNALINIVTDAAARMSAVLGYELPTIDYSSLEGLTLGAEDLEDGLDSASEAAKALKQNVAGFDELNIINPASGITDEIESGLNIDWSKYEYDFLGNITQNTEELENKLRPILEIVGSIATAFAGWMIVEKISPAISTMTAKSIADLTAFKKYLGSAAMIAVEFTLVYGGMKDALEGKLTGALQVAIGAAMGSAYLYSVWGKTGLTVGIGVAVAAAITAISVDMAKGGKTGDAYGKSALVSSLVGALGGAAAGFMVGGPYGAAIGALIGVGVSVVSTIVSLSTAIEKDKQEAYLNSQMRKDIFGDLLDEKGYMQLAADVNIKIGNMTADITDIEDKFSGIKEIVDRIFVLNALPEKTKTDMAELQALVETINNMQLDGLKIEYDSLTGSIISTKEEVYGVIGALEAQAKAIAYQEILVESYKEQIAISRELSNARKDLTKLENIAADVAYNLALIEQKKKKEMEAFIAINSSYMDQGKFRLELEGKYSAAIKEQKRILAEAQEKIIDTKGSIAELTATEGNLNSIISESISGLNSYNSSLDIVNDTLISTESETVKLGDTTDTVVKSVKDKLNELRNTDPIVMQIKYEVEELINRTYTDTPTNNGLQGLKNINNVTVSERASGGYVPRGDIFIANEKGPELVGTLNGKTAVANQNQMVDVAAKGVAEALKNYNPGSGEPSEIIVKVLLDGKQILTSTEKAKRERGAALLPAGVVNYG